MSQSPASPAPLASADPLLPLFNWESLRLNLHWAYEARPQYLRSTSVVTAQTAWLLHRGSVRVQWRSRELHLSAGQWLLLGAERGEHVFSDDAHLLSICFRAEWFTGQPFFDDSKPILFDNRDSSRLERAARRLVRLAQGFHSPKDTLLPQQPSTFSRFLRLRQGYLAWLDAMADQMHRLGVKMQSVGPRDARILQAVAIIEAWPLEKPFDERQVAESVNLSIAHFNRLCAVELGVSAKACFERRRLAAAREFLLADDMPIKNVTFRLGFHDPAHFSHWFSKRTGVSPSHFRTGNVTAWKLT